MKSILFAGFTAMCAAIGAFGSADAVAQAKALRIGVEAAYPPFSEVGPDGKLKGFDIDIANALCEQMKAQCTLVQTPFDGMIPALQAKKIDAVVASMSITEERAKQVAFTDKYYQTPARAVAKFGANIDPTPAGLTGKRVGVQRGTTHDRYATETFKGAEIVRYVKQDDAYADLGAGKVDVLLVDGVAAAMGFLKTDAGRAFKFVGPAYNDPKHFGQGAGIALRKADAAQVEQFNAAIKAIRSNGVYKKIADTYFRFDIYTGDMLSAPSPKK